MTGVPIETRLVLLRQHGSFTQAYSAALQPDLEHFGDKGGFIAYKKIWGTALALSDPVAPKDNVRDLLGRFCDQNPDATFWQVSHDIAQILVQLGFFANEMGPETKLDLAAYDFSGNSKQNLRSAINRAVRQGYTTRESSIELVGVDKVRAVSNAWRRTRTIRDREVCFLTRPMVFDDGPDVRAFFTFYDTRELVAFFIFDPIYESGEVVGYIAQHSRYRPDCDSVIPVAARCAAIEKFQAEGRKWMSLGLSPFAVPSDTKLRLNTQGIFRICYQSALFNRFVYGLQGHAMHKRQYRGIECQTYYAFNRRPALPRIIKLLRACDII
jgi:lysylphosphatidylglycerol synthetase-like protein (DUF2156 family)